MDKYLKFPPFYFFCLYSILFVIFTFFSNYILYDDALYYKSFGDTLGIDRIDAIIGQQKVFQKIGYWLIPIIILLRVFYTSICLTIGSFLLEKDLKFAQCFNISIKADVIFLFELMIKIDYFSIIEVNSIEKINVRLFSILQLLGVKDYWMSYPLSILNVFEIIYWITLAIFLSNRTKKPFWVSSANFGDTHPSISVIPTHILWLVTLE
jgi:hypothetical protein